MEEAIMLAAVPDEGQMTALLGEPLYAVWTELCAIIDEKYYVSYTHLPHYGHP